MSDPTQTFEFEVSVGFEWTTRELTASHELNVLLLQVERNTDVIESSLILISGLRALINQAIATHSTANLSTALAALDSAVAARAVVANTQR